MPYGYDVANAKLPQAADPIGSLMQGGVQGITLGLGLQRARQDAQTNQLQQQAAQLEIEKQNYDKFKRYLDMAQSPSFQSWSPQDQETIVKKVGESAIPALGIQLDMSNYKYDSKHKKLVDDLAEINNDPSLPVESKRTLSVNRINQEMYKLSKDEHEQFMKGQEFALKQPQPESFTFQGFSGNQPTFSSNKSTNLITGGGVTAENFISKSEPSKIKEQQIDIAGQQDLVSSLRDKLNSIPSSIGGVATSGLAKVSGGIIAPETKAYLDIMPSAAVKIYRSTTGDTRLSDADAAARAYPIMPKPWEPKELQDSKLKDIEDALNGRGSKLKSLLTTGNASGSDNPKLKIPTFSDTEEAEYQKWKKQQLTGK